MSKKYNRNEVDKLFWELCAPLNNEGNNNEALVQTRNLIYRSYENDDGYTTEYGDYISVKYVADRYKQYVKWWTKTYGTVDRQYLGSEKDKMKLEIFIRKKAYLTQYKQSLDQRFFELFGNNMTEEELFKSYEEFQKEKSIRAKYRF